jgi:branched-chain amino acid transport system permease protein
MDYILHIIIMIAIYSILCMSANILIGLTQKISLGFAAFYGVGAYVSALAVLYLKICLFPSLLLILLINGIFAFLLAVPSLRLKGDYFILATLGFQMIVYNILYNWTTVTKGPFGISGISNPVIFGSIKLDGIFQYFVFSILLAVLLSIFFYYLIKSPFGRVLRALSDDEMALVSLGKNINFYKISAFVIASAFTGVAGYIYATYISYIDPTSFSLDESIFILCALIIGGTGNIRGAVTGAVFVVLIPELLRFVGLPDSVAAPMRQIIYGAILIWVIFYRPQGIAGVKQYDN